MRLFSLALVLALVAVFALAGCSSPECESDAECAATGPCQTPRCVEGACTTVPKSGCCGNFQCEADAGETACTCEQDCSLEDTPDGTCDGKVQVPHPRFTDRVIYAEHARYYCEDDGRCVIGVPDDEVDSKQLFSTHRAGYASLEMIGSVSQPYVLG